MNESRGEFSVPVEFLHSANLQEVSRVQKLNLTTKSANTGRLFLLILNANLV